MGSGSGGHGGMEGSGSGMGGYGDQGGVQAPAEDCCPSKTIQGSPRPEMDGDYDLVTTWMANLPRRCHSACVYQRRNSTRNSNKYCFAPSQVTTSMCGPKDPHAESDPIEMGEIPDQHNNNGNNQQNNNGNNGNNQQNNNGNNGNNQQNNNGNQNGNNNDGNNGNNQQGSNENNQQNNNQQNNNQQNNNQQG